MRHETLSWLVKQLAAGTLEQRGVIRWCAPVPAFGDARTSSVATLGLNPSNREFVDRAGFELDGAHRRFPTLRSLRLIRWSDARSTHLQSIDNACRDYFGTNPYDGWFRKLDSVISHSGASFYGKHANACHLDLVPYATSEKWSCLSAPDRQALLLSTAESLALTLRESTVRVLILNGMSVVRAFENIAGVCLDRQQMREWTLPRERAPVAGYSYVGSVRRVRSVALGREISVLGYNHNIQSSFGVTTKVVDAIGRWIGLQAAWAVI